jgi:hypothetical protein
LNRNKHHNKYFQSSWNKYGAENFEFIAIEGVTDLTKLIEREQYWIDIIKPKYNLSPTAGNTLGMKHTEQSKIKRSIALKGLKRSAQSRINLSLAKLKQSDETKRKIGLAHKGKIISEETKRKLSEFNKGKPSPMAGRKHSLETKIKMSKDRQLEKILPMNKWTFREYQVC